MQRRSTKSKQDVLELLKTNSSAMSHEMVEGKIEGYNRTTIYRVLNRFCDDGIIHRIVGINGKQYFAICSNCVTGEHKHNHLHFQCEKCEKVECLEEELSLNIPSNYHMKQFNGLVSGVCSDCG